MRRAGWIAGIVLISFELCVSASASRNQSTSRDGVSDEEYEIYTSVITQTYVRPDTKLLVIEERTFRYDFAVDDDEPWRDKKKGVTIEQAAVEDYEAKNSQKWLLNKESFKFSTKISLITDLDLQAIFHGNWGELQWINYYRRFPDSRGFIMLSRIGFNTDKTQALLYIGSRCGRGCGDIHFLLLEKTNGIWATKKELRKKEFG